MRRNGLGCAAVMFNQQAVVGGGWGGKGTGSVGTHSPVDMAEKARKIYFYLCFFFFYVFIFSAGGFQEWKKPDVFAELFSLTRNTKPKTPLAKICKVLFILIFYFLTPSSHARKALLPCGNASR